MALILLVAGIVLLALPALTRRFGRHLRPDEWARMCTVALVGGALTLEMATVLYGAPTVFRALGVTALATACERLLGPLVPGGAPAGWAAAAAAITMPALYLSGAVKARRSQRAVHAEDWLGEHRAFGSHELVVLPTQQLLAVAVHAGSSQIVVSQGMVDQLSADEFETVMRHEAAHLDHGHHRFLVVATAIEHGLAFLPPVRRSTAVLRGALERWADEAAAGETAERRAVSRAALYGVVRAMVVPPALAAFSAADTVVERLDALQAAPPAPSRLRRGLVYAPGLAVGASILLALGASAADAQMVVAMAGRCVA